MKNQLGTSRIRGFVLVSVACFAMAAELSAQTQDEQEPIDPTVIAKDAEHFKAINIELEQVAKEIAELLKHPGFRGQLRGEINGAKTTENIIVLDRFLEKVSKQNQVPPGLQKARKTTGNAVRKIKESPAIELTGVDLYFPVSEHRAKWKGNEDILVAYATVNEEAEKDGVVAFSVKTGERLRLNPEEPPTTPVLIVAAEEHVSHDPNYVASNKDPVPKEGLPTRGKITSPPGQAFDKEKRDPGKPGQFPGNSYLWAYYTMIKHDGEPWTRGNPEIEIYLMQECGSSMHYRRLDAYDLNDTYRWTYTGRYGALYFDNTCSDRVFSSIWERDSGSWVRGDCHTFPSGRRHCFNVRSGDDPITGGKYYWWPQNVFYKSSFPYNSVYNGLIASWGAIEPLKRQ